MDFGSFLRILFRGGGRWEIADLVGFLRGFRENCGFGRGFLMVKRGEMCGGCGRLAPQFSASKNTPTF
jgi:hypothetical protein